MRFKAGGKAHGFDCPDCDSEGPHNVQLWRYDDENRVSGIVLSCHSCECVFELELR